MLRHVHVGLPGCVLTYEDMMAAVSGFFTTYGVRPTRICASFDDLMNYQKTSYNQGTIFLKKEVEYGNFVSSPFGPIPLEIISPEELSLSKPTGTPIIVVENNAIDKAFEEEVLAEKK